MTKALFLAAAILALGNTPAVAAPLPIKACFVPDYEQHTQCSDMIISAINSARHTILVQAYFLTDDQIIDALAAARQRGAEVKIVLDGTAAAQDDGKEIATLGAKGLVARIDEQHTTMNDRVMVIDDGRVITGSYNFTWTAANADAENVLLIDDASIAALYRQNFERHWEHSRSSAGLGH